LTAPLVAEASDPFLRVLSEDELAKQPAARYAKMTKEEALAELSKRGAIFEEVPADKASGVVAPIRLTARLNGVHVHGTLPAEQAVVSPFEILDARLALSLWDFADILAKHDVDEIVHYSMYRPGLAGYSQLAPYFAPKKATDAHGEPERAPSTASDPHGKTASNTKSVPMRLAPLPKPVPEPKLVPPSPSEGQTTSRHPAGLAIDAAVFKKKSGGSLSVASQFAGHIGAKTCGEGATEPTSDDAKELRSILCEAADAGLFTYVLSPNFNAAHRDHFHMEIKGGVRWTLIH
jgi:hypothetical protein